MPNCARRFVPLARRVGDERRPSATPGYHREVRQRVGRLRVFGRPAHLQPPPFTVKIERWVPDTLTPLTLRDRVELVVESLIDLLDVIDGDTDVEPGTDDDACPAEDFGFGSGAEWYPGNPEDGEPNGDELDFSYGSPNAWQPSRRIRG